MTHEEVMKYLLNGHKIRKTSWHKDDYIVMRDGYITDGNSYRTICVFSDNERLGKFERKTDE